MARKILVKGNYLILQIDGNDVEEFALAKCVYTTESNHFIIKEDIDNKNYKIPFSEIGNWLDELDVPFTEATFTTLLQENTGKSNGGATSSPTEVTTFLEIQNGASGFYYLTAQDGNYREGGYTKLDSGSVVLTNPRTQQFEVNGRIDAPTTGLWATLSSVSYGKIGNDLTTTLFGTATAPQNRNTPIGTTHFKAKVTNAMITGWCQNASTYVFQFVKGERVGAGGADMSNISTIGTTTSAFIHGNSFKNDLTIDDSIVVEKGESILFLSKKTIGTTTAYLNSVNLVVTVTETI